MKRITLTFTLILTVCIASFASKTIAEGKTFSTLGNYKIEALENPFMLNGRELKAFVISYDNTNMKVTVAVDKQNKCKKYYVLSDNLSIQYTCNGRYFGVEKLDSELEKYGYRTCENALNNDEYFRQKLITNQKNSDLENSKLIAAFYPGLLKNTKIQIPAM
jgi:uncharacterized CHY-type Zn-finger protein